MRSLLGLLLGCLLITACGDQKPVQSEAFVMNTFLAQTVYGTEEDAESDTALVRDLEAKLSRTLPDSEIRSLADAAGSEVPLSEDTRQLLQLALDAQQDTGGAYSPFLGELRDLWGFGSGAPAVPDAAEAAAAAALAGAAELTLTDTGGILSGGDIDLGGAAKGFALDLIRENLEARGVSAALIDFGGALLVRGRKPSGMWRIGIRDPLTTQGSSIAEFEAEDVCIETSGIAEQQFTENGVTYHHLLDPVTGQPADNTLAAVTVVSASGTEADIYATALFIMGLEDGLAFADGKNLAALFVTREREIIPSASFPYTVQITDDAFTLR